MNPSVNWRQPVIRAGICRQWAGETLNLVRVEPNNNEREGGFLQIRIGFTVAYYWLSELRYGGVFLLQRVCILYFVLSCIVGLV